MYPNIDMKATGQNIKHIMEQQNVSIKELQAYLGLSSIQTIYHWFEGITIPSTDNLYAISKYFNVDIDDLICGDKKHLTEQEKRTLARLKSYSILADGIVYEREFYK